MVVVSGAHSGQQAGTTVVARVVINAIVVLFVVHRAFLRLTVRFVVAGRRWLVETAVGGCMVGTSCHIAVLFQWLALRLRRWHGFFSIRRTVGLVVRSLLLLPLVLLPFPLEQQLFQ